MITFKKDTLKFAGNYRGKVVSNADSSNLGRIKVEIFGVFDGIAAADIPWAVPAFPLSSGAGVGFGSFAVPEVDSYVWCFFESEDHNQPVYFAEATDGVHGLPSERITNYPSRKVFKTKSGVIIYIDDSSDEIKISQPSGTHLTIDGSGNITLSSVGAITVSGTGAVTISGSSVNINP